jgi:hypothetical protein
MSEKERPAATAIADRTGICTWTMSDARLRRQQQCELIWQIGPRALFELFDQLDRHHCLGDDLDRRLIRFAALDLKFYGPSEVINSRLPRFDS